MKAQKTKKPKAEPDKAEKKIIFYMFNINEVCFLIPKKRGTGFLKVPAGHHFKRGDIASTIQHELGYDCCGLDGSLDVETGYTQGKDFPKLYTLLHKYYGYPVKRINRDKWFELLQKKQ